MFQSRILLDNGTPDAEIASDLVVPWWSFGKTLIAATALRLAEQAKLSLERPMGRYTLTQLLRHEAGLRDYGGILAYHHAVERGDEPWSREVLLQQAKAEELAFEPGQGWAYSNIGYLFVRELIEEAYGADLRTAVRDLVFEPLGLEAPRLARKPEDLHAVAMGSAAGYHPGWVYHGLFVGPLADAALWLDAVFSQGSPLSARSRDLMLAPTRMERFTRPPWAMAAYGAGVMCPETREGWVAAGHTGSGPGSRIAVNRRMEGVRRTAAAFAYVDDHASDVAEVEVEVERLLSAKPIATADSPPGR